MYRRISEIAAHRGLSERELLTEELTSAGSIYQAALNLNVYPNSLRHQLRKLGLGVRRRVVLEIYELDKP